MLIYMILVLVARALRLQNDMLRVISHPSRQEISCLLSYNLGRRAQSSREDRDASNQQTCSD